jgi:hypothetical protein
MGGKFKDRQRQKKTPKTARGPKGATKAQLRRANKRGISLEERWEKVLRRRYKYVFKQTRVQGFGKPRKSIPGPGQRSGGGLVRSLQGGTPKADFLVGDSVNELFVIDSKQTPNSGFTKNQEHGYPNIRDRGGEVIAKSGQKNSKTGRTHNLRGRKLKANKIIILYEVDLVAIEAGQTTLDDVVNKRRGQLNPKPTPLQLPPADVPGLKSGSDGTSNNGTDEDSRGRSRPENGKVDGKSRSVDSPGSDPPQAKPKKTSVRTKPPSTTPSNVPNVKLKPGKVAFRFVRGLIIDQLVSLAVGLFVNYFEKKVAEENQKRVRSHWIDKVYPKVEPHIRDKIQMANEGSPHLPRKRVYAGVGWTVIMQELDEDASDVVVWAGKFVAGDPGFGEVFHDLEVHPGKVMVYIKRGDGPPPKTKTFKRRRDERADDLLRYGYYQYILLHDPKVLKFANSLRKDVQNKRMLLKKIDDDLVVADPGGKYGKRVRNIDERLQKFQFTKAGIWALNLLGTIERDHLVVGSSVSNGLKQLAKLCRESDTDVFMKKISFYEEQRNLLNGLLGTKVL